MIEFLLTLSIMTILLGIGIPVYQNFQNKNDLDIAEQTVVQSLRRAQSLSRAGENDSSWGMKIQSGSIVVFKGVDYANRDTNFDESVEMPSIIVPSGVSEVVYSKFEGLPNTTGTLFLTSQNEVSSIQINSAGLLTY